MVAHMSQQLDLLTYPAQPGYKAPGPSREAAEAVKPTAATLRKKCLALLHKHQFASLSHGGLTADEVARVLDESILSIRPRIAELKEMGFVEDSGARRPNASGKRATVWRVKA